MLCFLGKMWTNYMKKFLNDGSVTIEASFVFVIFITAYLTINSIAMSIITESITRKAVFETGMDLATYTQIADRIGLADIVETNTIDEEDYKNIIMDELKSGSSGQQALSKIIDLLKKDIKEESKNNLFKQILESIFLAKINKINGASKLEDLGIQNFHIENLSILENNSQIEFSIKYKYKLDKFGIFSFQNDIEQKFLVDTWSSLISSSNDESIWNRTNFERGRYFLEKVRSENVVALKTGRGFDIYDTNTNTLIQVYSLNIFDQSYSNLMDGKYNIDEGFNDQLKVYYKKLEDNIKKYGDKVITSNGNEIEIANPEKKLYIILPEETKAMTDINYKINELDNLDEIEFLYMEKAFND